MRIGLDISWYRSAEARKILENIYQVLQKPFADSGEIKAIYCYTGEPAVNHGSLPAIAMAYFAAQVLNIETDNLRDAFMGKLRENSLSQNYYGQSMAFFPLAFEDQILKKP